MRYLRNVIRVVLLVAPLACAPAEPPPDFSQVAAGPWEPMRSAEYRMATAKLGQVPNSGLLLPAVSSDGRWIASLQAPVTSPVDLADLLSGEYCEDNRLLVRQTTPNATTKVVCSNGAMWAAWSPTGGTLVFTARGEEDRGELGIHDVASGATHRMAVGPKRLAMPAVSPTGDKIALVDADNLPAGARIYILDLATRKLTPGPDPAKGDRQLWPHWIDAETIVFLNWGRRSSVLSRWTLGELHARTVTALAPLRSSAEAIQLFASIGQVVRRDGSALVYYDPLADQLTVVELDKNASRGKGFQTRAGCWMGHHLVAAGPKDLYLFPDEAAQDEGNRLLPGIWLPLWASDDESSLLLCTRGSSGEVFDLFRLHLVWRR